MENAKCINCGKEVSQNYCGECGQKKKVNRISIKTFFEDYLGRLFGMDTNFLRTVRDLTLRPGSVGRIFVEGNRMKYIGPVGYFFLIVTLSLITYSVFDVDVKEFLNKSGETLASSEGVIDGKGANVQKMLLEKVSQNMKVMSFMIIPFLALWGTIFYRKSGLNYFEHSVNAFYVEGHLAFLNVVAVILYKLTGFVVTPYAIFINSIVYAWSTIGFYNTKGVKGFIKGVIYYLVSMLTFMIAFGLMIVGVLLIYAKINPEFMEQFN